MEVKKLSIYLIIRFADGTEKYIHDGGEEETIFQDGTV